MKKDNPKHGQLALRDVHAEPWSEVHADTIGPWTFKVNGLATKISALTMIDPDANLVEIARVHSTKAAESSTAFVNTWLSHCPLPEKIVADGGPEFVGHEWEHMLMNWGLKEGRSSARAPTANSAIESSHGTVGQILRAIFESSNPRNRVELDQVVADAVASTVRAMRCAAQMFARCFGVRSRHASQCSDCDGCHRSDS